VILIHPYLIYREKNIHKCQGIQLVSSKDISSESAKSWRADFSNLYTACK